MSAPKAPRSYVCPGCGGSIRYDISRQLICCASCGRPAEFELNPQPVREHTYSREAALASRQLSPAAQETASVVCQSCGAEVSFAARQTAALCPMCGSPQIAELRQAEGLPPDGIIPFKIDQYQAQERFHKWLRGRWFAPGSLKRSYQEGRLTPVYLPYWTFDANASASYAGRGGRIRAVRVGKQTSTTVDWFPVSGTVHQNFDDIQICAAANARRQLAEQIKPFGTTHNCLPYDPAYLAGAQAERYAKPLDDAYGDATGRIDAELNALATSQIMAQGFQQAVITSLKVNYGQVAYKQALLPVWLAAFDQGGKTYRYAINGETGKVSGERPYSPLKIALAVLAFILCGLLFVLLFSDDAYAQTAAPPQANCAITTSDINGGTPNGIFRTGKIHGGMAGDQAGSALL